MRFPRSIFFAFLLALFLSTPAGLFGAGDAQPTVDIEVIAHLRFSIKNTCWKNTDSGFVRALTFDDKKVWLTVDGFTAGSDEWSDYGNGQYRTPGALYTLAADGKTLFERSIAGNSTRIWARAADPVVTPKPANPAPLPATEPKPVPPPANGESESASDAKAEGSTEPEKTPAVLNTSESFVTQSNKDRIASTGEFAGTVWKFNAGGGNEGITEFRTDGTMRHFDGKKEYPGTWQQIDEQTVRGVNNDTWKLINNGICLRQVFMGGSRVWNFAGASRQLKKTPVSTVLSHADESRRKPGSRSLFGEKATKEETAPEPEKTPDFESPQKTKKLRAFAWTSADVSNRFETLELNVSSKIKSAGTLEVDFCYGDGFSGLEMESAALVVDGKIVSEDKHPGNCGFPFSSRDTRYVLTVPKNAVGAGKLSLFLRILSSGNCDTSGNIVLGGEAARTINEKIRGGLLGESVRKKTFWQSPENGLYYVFSADGAAWATIADRAGERWMKGSWRIVGNNPARLEADFSKSRISVRGRSSAGGETGPRVDFPKKTRVRFVISKDGKTLERDDGEIFTGKDSV